MNDNQISDIQSKIDQISAHLDSALKISDIPVGSRLAKEFNLSFGDLDVIESQTDVFIWGFSTWGDSRIGGTRLSAQ